MNKHLALLLLCALVCPVTDSVAQQSSSVKVTADSFMQGKGKDEQTWAYKITLQNSSGRELTGLEVRHRIYLHHEVGPTGGKDSPVSFIEGKTQIASLKGGATTTVNTPGMDFAIPDDLKVKADKHILQGIWVRVFTADGKEIGSFVKPATLAKKMPWQ
jgi:hypothetical protein